MELAPELGLELELELELALELALELGAVEVELRLVAEVTVTRTPRRLSCQCGVLLPVPRHTPRPSEFACWPMAMGSALRQTS